MSLSEEQLTEIRDRCFEPKGDWATSRVERVLDAARILPGERVLDLGCSSGTFSFHTLKAGANTISLDRDLITLTIGREAALIIGGIRLNSVCGDALAVPFADGFFDVVINADFIEHTPDKVKTQIFEEMFRVLKPEGRGVVYTPNLARIEWELFGEKIKRAFGVRREKVPRWQDFVDPDHFGLTTPGKTRHMLKAVGFETQALYFEHHIPLISKIPIVGGLTAGWFPSQFAGRFLIQVKKPTR
jgi:SAM-dependent methyltransferase